MSSERFTPNAYPRTERLTPNLLQAWRTGEFRDGWEEIRFVTRVEGGKVVLSNGRALMKCGGVKSRL